MRAWSSRSSKDGCGCYAKVDGFLLSIGDGELHRAIARLRQEVRVGPRSLLDIRHRDGIVITRQEAHRVEIVEAGTRDAHVSRLYGPMHGILRDDDDEAVADDAAVGIGHAA